jgi:hypothetical protein
MPGARDAAAAFVSVLAQLAARRWTVNKTRGPLSIYCAFAYFALLLRLHFRCTALMPLHRVLAVLNATPSQ